MRSNEKPLLAVCSFTDFTKVQVEVNLDWQASPSPPELVAASSQTEAGSSSQRKVQSVVTS